MHHRLTELGDFRIAGRKTRIPIVASGDNDAIAAFHAQLPGDLRSQLLALADVDAVPGVVFVTDDIEQGDEGEGTCDYYVAVATSIDAADLPRDLDTLEVTASTWVAFEGEGALPQALQNLWADSFGEWFPSNPYRVAPGPSILRVTSTSEDGSTGSGELWMPVDRTPA